MRYLLIAALSLFLAGCGDWFSSRCDAECVADTVEKVCNVAPSVADIATVMQVPGAPAGRVLAQYICDQWETVAPQAALMSPLVLAQEKCAAIVNGKCCIAVVNGVCIEKAE